MNRTHSKKGFTLIEILIAMTIFAIMATITSLTLSSIFSTRQRVQSHANSLAAIQYFYHLAHQDIAHIRAKAMFNKQHRPMGSLIGRLDSFTLTRDQFMDIKKSTAHFKMQRIGYQFENGQLYRLIVNNENETIKKKLLLKRVQKYKISYLDTKNYWREKWHDWQHNSLPKAIRLKLSIKEMGDLSFILSIPQNETIKIDHTNH